MSIRTVAAAAAALSLAASPALAQSERTSAPTSEAAELGNDRNRGSSLILALLAIAAIIVGIIIAVDNDNDGPLSA